MLQTKRTKIHQKIRKEALQSIFTLRRKELVIGKLSIFKELDTQIYSQQPLKQDEQIPHKIINCLKSYPEEQNTYIVVGNYLLWNKHQYNTFFSLLTESPKYLENQMWCYHVIACIIDELITRESWNHQGKIEQMEEIASASRQIVLEMRANLKRATITSEKELKIWICFQEILRLQLNCQIYNQFPHESIVLAQQILAILPVDQKGEEVYEIQHTWQLLKDIYRHIDQIQIKRELFSVSWSIIWLTLKHHPHQREDCINLLTTLLERHSVDFMSSLFHENIAVQILYIFDQVAPHKAKIALFLKQLLPMCTIQQLLFMVSKGSHKLLTQSMEWSMNTCDNQCLQDSMAALYFLLSRFKDYQEDKLVQKILSEIQQYHFDEMLQGMVQQPQNPAISKYLNILIDDFYSQQQSL